MGEADVLAEVLSGIQSMEIAPAQGAALRAAVADDVHLRQLRRACGCALCSAHLEEHDDHR
jgi:hypothetical protein